MELRFAPKVFLEVGGRFIFTENKREDFWDRAVAGRDSVESV